MVSRVREASECDCSDSEWVIQDEVLFDKAAEQKVSEASEAVSPKERE